MLPEGHKLAAAYIAERDGWLDSDWHAKVNGRGPTLTVIKADTGSVFGAYTDITFEDRGAENKNGNSFIFYFKDGVAKKAEWKSDREILQYTQEVMPAFARAFIVFSNCNTNYDS